MYQYMAGKQVNNLHIEYSGLSGQQIEQIHFQEIEYCCYLMMVSVPTQGLITNTTISINMFFFYHYSY